MGRRKSGSLNDEFDDPVPRTVAQQIKPHPTETVSDRWLKDNSFNTDTYEEIFTLPKTVQVEKLTMPLPLAMCA